jgi:hypothetical protein
MSISRPFAYNPGLVLSGTTQYGTLAVGVDLTLPYASNYGGIQWWNGPDEELGFCIGTSNPSSDQPTPIGNNGNVGFWRTNGFDDQEFIALANTLTQQNFTNGNEAKLWLNDNGYWTSYDSSVVTPTPTPSITPTITPTVTETPTNTPTPTLTETPTSTPTPTQSTVSYNIQLPVSTNVYGNFSNDLTAACNSVECLTSPSSCSWNSGNSVYSTKPDYNSLQVGDIFYTTSSLTTVATSINGYRILFTTPNFSLVNIVNGVIDSFVSCTTPTPTPSVTPTITPTSSEVPVTPTPTPSTSPVPMTGYGYNLVVLPYNPPTSGNTIFPTFANPGLNSGTTNPNTFTTNGVYWNPIDNLGVDRTIYYSGMTGVSVTAYFTQNGDTAIYSGSTTAFTIEGPLGQESFNYNPQARPGQLMLIQSASSDFVTGQTVNISYIVN